MAVIATPHPDITRLLTSLGLEVLETSDPRDAARRAELVVVPFVNRPLSGVAWCRALADHALPVLVVARSEDECAEALAAGASDVIRHPLSEAVVGARVTGWLAAARSWAAERDTPPVERMDTAFEALPEAVLLADPDGLVLHMNRAALALTGHAPEEGPGLLNITGLYASAIEGARLLVELRRSRGQVIVDRPVELRGADGRVLPTRLSAGLVLGRRGRVTGIALLLRDDRQNAELAQRLAHCTAQLVEAERKSADARAAAEAVRELNQPLTTAMGLIELVMLRPSLGPESRERLERAYAQLERLAEGVRRHSRPPAPPAR